MERLTEERPSWIDDEFWTAAREPDDDEIDAVYLRLKAYEDTGLKPEEIQTGLEQAKVYAAMLLLKQYQSIGPVEEFRALKEAEEKRREGENKLLNPTGEYAAKFAENHGINIAEAMEKPMVKARFAYFADTGM